MSVLRPIVLFASGCWLLVGGIAAAQYYGPPGRIPGRNAQPNTIARRPFDRPGALERNQMPVRNTDAVVNTVITPIPLTATRLEAAKDGVDRQIRDLVEDLRPV